MPTYYMNAVPRGTVRRSAEGALLVREFQGDISGWKLVASGSENCLFFGDWEIDPLWMEWPIIWCPDATFKVQDNIRRAQGARLMRPQPMSHRPSMALKAS
jgi:hypothetical protein